MNYKLSDINSSYKTKMLFWAGIISGCLICSFLCVVESGFSNLIDDQKEKCILYSGDADAIVRQDCRQCHKKTAQLLQDEGRKHKLTCRKCHLPAGEYDPAKLTKEDIIPKCSTCHKEPPRGHGDKLTDCQACHVNNHAPRDIPSNAVMADNCYLCHEKIDKDVKTFVTMHTELYCTGCHHSTHRYKPNCQECHQPHKDIYPLAGPIPDEKSPFKDCLSCHPPHKAKKVAYPNSTSKEACALCHPKQYEMLHKNITKHSAQQCTRCHPDKHQTIKRCRECHGIPHLESVLTKFKVCGECHGVAHNVSKIPLPTNACEECHVNRSAGYAQKNNLWLHAPVQRDNCPICHIPHFSKEKSTIKYRLRQKPENLCVICHSEGLIRMTESHRKTRKCLECHNPHLGKDKRLLLKDYKEDKILPKLPKPFPDAE